MGQEPKKNVVSGEFGKGRGGGVVAGPSFSSIDRLEYMADLVLELERMAEAAGCKTLAAILALALVEARQQCQLARK